MDEDFKDELRTYLMKEVNKRGLNTSRYAMYEAAIGACADILYENCIEPHDEYEGEYVFRIPLDEETVRRINAEQKRKLDEIREQARQRAIKLAGDKAHLLP